MDGDGDGETVFVAGLWEASVFAQRGGDGRVDRVFTLGTGFKGELGLGPILVKMASATLLDFVPAGREVVDLAACMSHVVAVLDNGDVYGWGNGRKGQLGEPVEAVVAAPRRVDGVGFEVRRAVCGRKFTVLFGDAERGEVRFLGEQKYFESLPEGDEVRGWTNVAAGWGAVYVLKPDGKLLAWGRDDHGQLPPKDLPALRSIAAGSEHVVALTKDGEEVLTWGWGEHGNCGPNVPGPSEGPLQGDVKGRYNVITRPKIPPPWREYHGASEPGVQQVGSMLTCPRREGSMKQNKLEL